MLSNEMLAAITPGTWLKVNWDIGVTKKVLVISSVKDIDLPLGEESYTFDVFMPTAEGGYLTPVLGASVLSVVGPLKVPE